MRWRCRDRRGRYAPVRQTEKVRPHDVALSARVTLASDAGGMARSSSASSGWRVPHDKDPRVSARAGRWLRGWTAEENRHGDLLNAYLRLTGRVDMRSVERTVHHLIRNGFAVGNEGNDTAGLIYAAFQERATRVNHGNMGRLAAAQGDENLARICRRIAGDETRHEVFYTRVVGQLMERDPEGGMLAYRAMLRGIIAMPGRLMDHAEAPDLFEQFAAISQRVGVYTAKDYAEIIGHLNEAWGIAHRSLSGKAAKAQDYLCRQPERYGRLAGEIADRLAGRSPARFSWVRGRQV